MNIFDWDSDEEDDNDFSYETTNGENDTDADADLETDSENQDRDGNLRDISDEYAPTGVESGDDPGSCCHWSTSRRFIPGTTCI